MHDSIPFEKLPKKLLESIQFIYNENQDCPLGSISHLNPVLAGGFPMALLFAPRDIEGKISSYFSDYDLFFEKKGQAEEAIKLIKSNLANPKLYKTKNASTITGFSYEDDQPRNYQVITKFLYSRNDVVSKFDFTNCSIGFLPSENKFILNKSAISDHSKSQLNDLNLHFIDKIMNETISEKKIVELLSLQLERISKYTYRWNYDFSPSLWEKITSVYLKYPKLCIPNSRSFTVSSGLYNGHRSRLTKAQNLWIAYKQIFQESSFFKDFVDPHSILKTNN
jgi:hypothetical protein